MRTTRMDPDTARTVQALVADVDALAAVPVCQLSVDALAELVGALSTATSRLRGITSRALGEAHERGGGLLVLDRHADLPRAESDEVPVATRTWLRHTAHLSVGRAGSQVRTARALRELPRVTGAVVAGVITAEHAGVLARLVGKLETAALVDGQDELIEMAGRADPEGLGHYVAHLIATWCEPDLDEQERKAEARRHFQLTNCHDGSWSGRFCLPDAAMETIKSVLEPLARPAGLADGRSAGQRRADALVDVFAMAAGHADLPEAGGQRPTVTYVVPAAWAEGRPPPPFRPNPGAGTPASSGFTPDSTSTAGCVGAEPERSEPTVWPADRWCASAAWTGPVTRSSLATAGCDARVEVARITRDGRILSLTALGEAISKAQRRAVWARDRHCVVRGCIRPPAFCDVHHVQARAEGGATAVENLVLLCRRHHTGWHRGQVGLSDLWAPWLDAARVRAGPG